ncbi:DEAD/DEAH box helicase [Streptococcus oricebi]|uniref:RNA helicase n=1 Tax=Streptococcus oricebi TaxID=1547447 RepID=A0ABS5B3L7_9STRE|nr:DEAD/DEAH box helicase [Streptococcus oricebi]MBP2623428.1 RNA helicase [Streptococcus oricebi]
MAKLIPGKIRAAGRDLYEAGKVEILEVKKGLIYSRIEEHHLRYSLEDEAIFCACDLFHKKKYCSHLAALEYYLKQDKKGQELWADLQAVEDNQQERQIRVSFGNLFLDQILPDKPEQALYYLSAQGSEDSYTGQFLWTLRIRRWPDERSYVVRDIRALLQVLTKGGRYQIGKSYYESLDFQAFDEASQALLTFLQALLSNRMEQDSAFLFPNSGRHLYFSTALLEEGLDLLQGLEAFHLEYSVYHYQQVFFQDLVPEAELYYFEVTEQGGYFELTIHEKTYKLLEQEDFIFHGGIFYQLSYQQKRILGALRSLPLEQDRKKRLQFEISDQDKLAASLLEFKKLGPVQAPKSLEIQDFQVDFSFGLASNGDLSVDLSFSYPNQSLVTSRAELAQLPFASNFEKEQLVFQTLLATGFTADFHSHRPALKRSELYSFFEDSLKRFRELGQVELSSDLEDLYQLARPSIAIENKGGFLEIGFDFAGIEETEVNQALTALFEAQDYYVSQAGQLLVFDEDSKKISQTLKNLRASQKSGGILESSPLLAYQLLDLFEEQEQVSFSQNFRQLAQDLSHPASFPLPDLAIQAELRDYQERGVRWLAMLDHYHFGGILADDMGLGKTLQTIAFLSSRLTEQKKVLILAPSSLIYNWSDEFTKFAPQLDLAVIYGLKSRRDELIAEEHQIYITSYNSFRQDQEEYRKLSFDYLILDEAQVMKNDQTKIAQHLRSFEVKHTFALSGTPIENHLGELWSIFQIILPGLLPAKKEFLKMPAELVARYIKPFVLRRKKEEVLQELPDLIEISYKNELADSQKAIYLAQLKQMQERVMGASEEELNRSKIEILSGLMRLRQICDTPALFMEDYQGESGKLESLIELLEQIKAGKHRVLIFSQFRGMLDVIESELEKHQLSSFKITGSTPAKERQAMTQAFNEGDREAFLISLKAGGVGLNLTGADTVILVDLWWNPAVEAQAIGRAHRMGQERNVEVYRLITRGTIEEKIQQLQESKKNLVSTILDGSQSRSSLSLAEIREILGISPEALEN